MRKVLGRMKQTISVLLAAAMIVTMMPQAEAFAYASEVQNVLDESDGGREIVEEENENGNVDQDGAGEENEKEQPSILDGDGSENPEETDSEVSPNPVTDGTEDGEETEVPDGAQDDDGVEASEEEADDLVPEETTETAEDGQIKAVYGVSERSVEEEGATTVRLNIPRYQEGNPRSFLLQVWYAIGDSAEFTRMNCRLDSNEYVDIPAKEGESLRVKLVPRKRVQIEEVSSRGMKDDVDATVIEPENPDDTENHIYAITVPADSEAAPACQIDIKADYHYTLHFVDVYASQNPDAQDNRSVAFYQHGKDETADSSAEKKDLIGETLELSGQEMQKFFSDYNYELEVQEGYTFYSIDSNSSRLRFERDRSYYENGYMISGSYDLGAEDITVFVLAEPTKQNHLKFNIPAELKDKIRIQVVTWDSVGSWESQVGQGLEDDDAVWIDSDRKVSIEVTTQNKSYTVHATGAENGGDPMTLPYDYRQESGNGWKTRFDLEDADISMKNGDVTVDLEEVAVWPVEFHPDWSAVRRIDIYSPYDKTFFSDDIEEESYIVWAAEDEQVKFTLETQYNEVGTLRVSTAEDGSGAIQTVYDSEDEVYDVYMLTPTEETSVYVTMAQGYEYRIDYDESDFSVKVCDGNGNPLELSADHKFLSTADRSVNFQIMVKMNSDKWSASSVYYESEYDGWTEAVRKPAYDDEDGYLCYYAENVDCNTYGTNVITVEGYHTNTITFAGNEEAFDVKPWLKRYERDYWGDWAPIGDIDLDQNNVKNKFTVRDGEEVYFTLHNTADTNYRLNLSLSGSGDHLQVYEDEDWDSDNDGTLYHFTATGDTTITVELTVRQRHTVTINKGDSVTAFQVSGNKTRPEGENGDTGTYLVRDGMYITISGITGDESTAGYRGKVVCEADGKRYEVPMKYQYRYNSEMDETEKIPQFTFEVTSDMTVTVDLAATTQPIVTFADDKLTSVKIWELGKKPAEDNLYDNESKTAVLSDEKEYQLDFQLQDGYAAQRVIWKDKVSGEERVLEMDTESEYRVYDVGVPQGDAEIVIEAVSGYTVQFDIPAGADITFSEDLTDYANDITTDKIQVIATDSFPFTMDGEGQYKLSPDSDAFTLEKVLKRDEYDWDYQYYQYVLKPVAGAQLPKTVTIKAEAYAKHAVTLDYPTEIKTIYLLDDTGESYSISNKQAEVQGINTVLGVKAIRGYAAKVSVQGSGESKELTPFRLAEDDVSEYYLGELNEDVTITVTVARSTQKLTYYKVGFYSAGNGVKIRDAATKALYSANEDYYDGGEFEYPYSILKGSSISFTVEPRDGYEIDGVYANGEVVKAVQNAVSQQDVYTVVPMADTLITVKISKIAEKYPITFTYPEAVKSVTVTGYELTDRKLEVKADTKLRFTVELADTKHKITSVAMNGKEAAYDRTNGTYSVTTIAEPMEVVITVTENIDKKVTFKNTVTHMLYSVATNDQVTESGTDTYTVAALAGVLRFTVTSSKKESVPAVGYVNAAGIKTVLQAKKQDSSETTVVYTYEIAVSDLATESEIVIGETSLASAEDKAKLEACINKYKDQYNQEEYTTESWSVYAKALKTAQDCMKKETATKAEVEAAIADLEKAVKGLTKKGEEPTPGAKEGLWFEILENPETADGSYVYTGAAIKPDIKVYNGDTLLEVKKDYTVAYKNNTNAGTATITVTGKGNFKGNDKAPFEIQKKDINDEDITAADVYAIMKADGKVTDPKPVVKFGKKTLKVNNDYKLIYPEKDAEGKLAAGEYTIIISTDAVKTVSGKAVPSANYTGSKEIKYTVCANDTKLMSKAKVTLNKTKVDYAGVNGADTEKPAVTSVKIGSTTLTEGVDYEVSYPEKIEIGKAMVTVTAKAGTAYFGSKSVTYTVNGTKLKAGDLTIEGIEAAYEYTGDPVYINDEAEDSAMRTLKVTRIKGVEAPVELKEDTDYKVSYKTGKKAGEHTNAGTVTVMITGINAYTGTVNKTFKITPVDLKTFQGDKALAGRAFAAEGKAKYTKTGAKPEIMELSFDGTALVEKQDYTVTYAKNTKVEPGKESATMTIKGKGNFKGQIKHPYEVTMASVEDVKVTVADVEMPTKFNKLKPVVKVVEMSTGKVLKAGTDYDKTITYYSDEACETPITAANFDTWIAGVKDQPPVHVYTKIAMKGNYTGETAAQEFSLFDSSKKITDTKKYTITVITGETAEGEKIVCDNKGNPFYTGAEIHPKVVITPKGDNQAPLLPGTDYEVSYSNAINKGKATVTVTAKGAYGGTKDLKFTIVSANMSWAEKVGEAATKALEMFSELMLQN